MSVQTMAAVWKGSQHGGSALLMMLAIADFSDDKGVAYPAVSTLATKTRMKPRNAHYLLGQLQESGELIVKIGAGPKGTNLYRIALDRLHGLQGSAGVQSAARVQAAAGVQGVAGVQPIAGGGALQCAHPLQPSAPEPSLNHQEPSSPSASPSKRLADCPFDLIRKLYNDSLPAEQVQWPPKKATTCGKDRKKLLVNRWGYLFTDKRDDGTVRAKNEAQGLDWFARFFAKAWEDDFYAGRAARGPSHDKWRCELDTLLTDKALARVLEA